MARRAGAALAAVRVLVERGDVGASESVVVFDCGIGQKYPPPPGLERATQLRLGGEGDIKNKKGWGGGRLAARRP